MARFYVGDVVYTTDQWHTAGTLRPHFVIKVMGEGRLWVVPLSHTAQGQWTTDELGGGTYIGPRDFRTGRRADFVLDTTTAPCELGERVPEQRMLAGFAARLRLCPSGHYTHLGVLP
ncbi:MAG: hypothetical protein LW834_21260 [Cyanobium sp. 49614_E6]|nr:hypothetical protein [Cyanobium sp. 49614_E6]